MSRARTLQEIRVMRFEALLERHERGVTAKESARSDRHQANGGSLYER